MRKSSVGNTTVKFLWWKQSPAWLASPSSTSSITSQMLYSYASALGTSVRRATPSQLRSKSVPSMASCCWMVVWKVMNLGVKFQL